MPEIMYTLRFIRSSPKMTFVLLSAVLIFVGVSFVLQVPSFAAEKEPPPEGGTLPAMKLPVPQSPEEVKYLGVRTKGFFKVPEVKADLVLVEIFSMYCSFCQKEAPVVNELYKILSQDKELAKRVKIMGIGVGNSDFEVNTFRKQYSVQFPLLPDPDYKMHDILGRVRTPFFLAVRLLPDGSHRVIYSKAGGFGDPKQFLDTLLSKAKMR